MAWIAPAATIASGVLNYFGAKEQGDENRKAQERINQENWAHSLYMAQNSIQMRKQDAEAAGVNPLYAIGAPTMSFAPSQVGYSAPNKFAPLGDMARNLGQDLSRATEAGASAAQRDAARVVAVSQGLTLENMKLRNDLLRSQIARINSAQVGPPMPAPGDSNNYEIPGQSATAGVKPKALEVAPGSSVQPQSESGAITDVGYSRTATGWVPVPSNDIKQRIEDNELQEWLWAWRNNVLPTFGVNRAPPPFKLKEGETWFWHPLKQEYQAVPTQSLRANRPYWR